MSHASNVRPSGIAPPPPPLVFSPQADPAAPAIDAPARRHPHYREASTFPISPALICSCYPTINGPQATALSQRNGLGGGVAAPNGSELSRSADAGKPSTTLAQQPRQAAIGLAAARRVGSSELLGISQLHGTSQCCREGEQELVWRSLEIRNGAHAARGKHLLSNHINIVNIDVVVWELLHPREC